MDVKTVQPGDVVSFGRFQNEPLRWVVLAHVGTAALLLCEDVLPDHQNDGSDGIFRHPYHKAQRPVTWEDCTLRSWLNNEFASSSFFAHELERIFKPDISNPDNPDFGTVGCERTRDMVFCLSVDEYVRYEPMIPVASCWWWLRTPGYDRRFAAGVNGRDHWNVDIKDVSIAYNTVHEDHLDTFGSNVAGSWQTGVRPALFIE